MDAINGVEFELAGLPLPDLLVLDPLQARVAELSPLCPTRPTIPSLASMCISTLVEQGVVRPEFQELPGLVKRELKRTWEVRHGGRLDDRSFAVFADTEVSILDFSQYLHLQMRTMASVFLQTAKTLRILRLDGVQYSEATWPRLEVGFPHLRLLSLNESRLPDRMVSTLILLAPHLASLSMDHCRYTDFTQVFHTLQTSSSLRELHVSRNSQLPVVELLALVQRLPLRSLTCNGSASWLTSDVFHQLTSALAPSLVRLHVEEFLSLSDEDVTRSLVQCGRLRSLSLANCWNITSKAIQDLSTRCIHLEELNLDGCAQVDDEAIVHLAASTARSLQRISLRECERITSVGLESLARHCSHLKQFDFASFSQPFQLLTQNCHDLRELRMRGNDLRLDYEMVETLVEACPLIERVSVEQNYFLPTRGIQLMARQWALQSVTLSDCIQLEDDALYALAKYSSQLEHLHIAGCFFSEAALTTLFTHSGRLQSINVQRVSQMSDECVRCMTVHCPELVDIDVRQCEKLSPSALEDLARSFPLVESLAFSSSITDREMEALSQCHRLRQLVITDASHVSPAVLSGTLTALIHLRTLNLSQSSMSNRQLAQILGQAGQLQELFLAVCSELSQDVLPMLMASSCETICLHGCGDLSPARIPNYEGIASRVQVIGTSGL